MDKKRALEAIEALRDYVFENWDDCEYGDELDEIADAVSFLEKTFSETEIVGELEMNGKKYFISE